MYGCILSEYCGIEDFKWNGLPTKFNCDIIKINSTGLPMVLNDSMAIQSRDAYDIIDGMCNASRIGGDS